MRKRRIIIAAITWCLAAVLILSLLPGCRGNAALPKISMNVDALSLVGMWEEVVKAAGIQEKDAHLQSFQIDTDHKGRVYISEFIFKALDNESDWTLYGVGFNENGEFVIYPSKTGSTEELQLAYNPRVLFTEIDKLGLAEVQSTSESFSIEVQPEYYYEPQALEDKEYFEFTNSQGQMLYCLADGELTPLQYVRIDVDRSLLRVKVNRTMWPSGSSGFVTAPEHPPEMWFLSEDLSGAEAVEYRENWRGREYRELVTGIQKVLPEGWVTRVIDREGEMEPPHGLDEPLFRVDFIDPTHDFETPGGKRYPSLRLYFYDIQDKEAVLAAIEAEKLYSWDIPQYFDETSRYIIVTSPLYINGGVYSDEAVQLYQPLENALKDYFE